MAWPGLPIAQEQRSAGFQLRLGTARYSHKSRVSVSPNNCTRIFTIHDTYYLLICSVLVTMANGRLSRAVPSKAGTSKPQRTSSNFRLALEDWMAESAAVVAAILLFAVIAVLMSQYDNTQNSAWSINLSTIVAVISTILRALLVFIVTKGAHFSISRLPAIPTGACQ